MTAGALFHRRWVRRLPARPAGNPQTLPRVSVVLAARDEQARIENTVRRLLAQDGVSVEVIVVDDRSADATGEILRRLALEDGRVKPRRVETLPDDWLGKCHACHRCAQINFSDLAARRSPMARDVLFAQTPARGNTALVRRGEKARHAVRAREV